MAEKTIRSTAQRNFTRNLNTLNALLDESAASVLVTPQYEKLKNCWEKLEDAHDDYVLKVDPATTNLETDADGYSYINDSEKKFNEVLKRYAGYLKTSEQLQRAESDQQKKADRDVEKQIEAEKKEEESQLRKSQMKEKFDSAAAELNLAIDSFTRINTDIAVLANAAESCKQKEWERVQTEFDSLKQLMITVARTDPSQDMTDINKNFTESAEKQFLAAKKWFMESLKDVVCDSSSSDKPSSDSSTKKEPVKLPKFEGDAKCSPFLKFPVWFERWEKLIQQYDEVWRPSILLDHLDDAAREKFVGYESDYPEAMERLKKFYGDPKKVVSCVMEEVLSPGDIKCGDYRALLFYVDVLERNFNRLKNLNIEHQISNVMTMSQILRKFPRSVTEKWVEHLSNQSSSVQMNCFPEFIVWLISMRFIWEQMANVDQKSSVKSSSFYGYESSAPRAVECYRCGREGHKRADCPDPPKSQSKKPPRGKPKVKIYWCALHKDDKTKYCWSASCQELRQMKDVNKRIQLLEENKDCKHCTADHKPEDCPKKERVCGGGRSDRGCSKQHKSHELFCATARVFSTQSCNEEEGVLLLIMNVRVSKRMWASVFWDLGSTSNFIRESFARACGFKGQEKTLSVVTLGGVEKDYLTVVSYNCRLTGIDGKVYSFTAYGMENITGALSVLKREVVQSLFPRLDDVTVQNLLRGANVDFLIGMKHPSWHPERAESAGGSDGDLWLYRGRFGVCIGGRHPMIMEETHKSDSLFHVNHVYHVNRLRSQDSCTSHELQFCPNRVVGYRNSETPSKIIELTDESAPTGSSMVPLNTSKVSCYVAPSDRDVIEVSSEPSPNPGEVVDSALYVGAALESNSGVVDSFEVASPQEESTLNSSSMVSRAVQPNSFLMQGGVLKPSCSESGVLEFSEGVEQSQCSGVAETTCVLQVEGAIQPPAPTNISLSERDVVQSFGTKTKVIKDDEMFFQLENLGVMIDPQCGGCKCSTCPIVGSKYSFSEQKQHDLIKKNLFYDESAKRWVTEYPWKVPRDTLPRNHKIAMQNLCAMEKRLAHDDELANDFCKQIQDMLDRGAAVVLSEEELSNWSGDFYYLALVGIKGKKKWLRICFDAARKQGGSVCMNDCLYKGPDRFMNNLLSVCIGFRNGRVAAAADLSKFHNQVQLIPADVHMQRFLWRGMRTNESPQTLAVAVNNFGVKPANCIATLALHKSAEMFEEKYPDASRDIKEQTYIDDELVAGENSEVLHRKTEQMDEITTHAGMKNKGWKFTGDEGEVTIGSDVGVEDDKVLGLFWNPKTDMFLFQVKLKLKRDTGDANGSVDTLICSEEELEHLELHIVLNRKIVLSNVMKIFDPLGLLSPLILQAKLLLRETWNVEGLGWDDPLPKEQAKDWLKFLKSLLELNSIQVPRSLWPEGEVEGLPMLIIFSDGSISAYGAAAYIRWEMRDGSFWSRLIMAKSKIAPKRIISVPRMELSGAVMGNRVKNFLLKETNIKFGRVINLVDSSTVLGYLHKESSLYAQFEGIKIAEVQSSNEFKDGKLVNWGWVPGCHNPADWCTKPRSLQDLMGDECFLTGPSFLRTKEEDWPIKFSFRTDKLEGEIEHRNRVVCSYVSSTFPDIIGRLSGNSSSWNRVVRAAAWLLRLVPSDRRPRGPLSCDEVNSATTYIIKEVQNEIDCELTEGAAGRGRYRKLAPMKDENSVWRVGSRLANFVPFTRDGKMPKILPTHHRVTLLIMVSAHQLSHPGLDGTLSRFYAKGFWTVRAGHVARMVKNSCVTCRKIAKITIEQPLGDYSYERLTMLQAWGFCQLDLFGPFSCRGDVNPKTTKKTWAVVIEDVNSGAVHLDIVQDYSTQAVLLTMRRFGALRGWPGIICSDPGSQLESAGGKLESWWLTMGDALRTLGSSKNFRWDISPADSPWRQGKAERRIGVVKKLLRLAIGDSRVTPVELQTILFECANICNERPMGLSKPREDGSYSLITPNQLIHGRSPHGLPDDVELADQLPVASRYRIIQHVTTSFWSRWSREVSPGLVRRQKWHRKGRNLQVNDVVMICETTKVKSKYRLAIVDEIKTSADGQVRSATVRYSSVRTSPQGKEQVKSVCVKRSVQRLCLILPVEEQTSRVEVQDHENSVRCVVGV